MAGEFSKSDVPVQIVVTTTPPDLFTRLARFPLFVQARMADAMEESLHFIHRTLPEYPPEPPTSWYKRTGDLGRSFGKSMGGAVIGQPDIFEIKALGLNMSGRIGSSQVHYNAKVVGERQGMPWANYWWNVTQVANMSIEGIVKIYQRHVTKLAAFLEGFI